MKRVTRKLIASSIALAMAVASTIGSTFAWFSMNTKVSATGMNVTVQTESTLLIDKVSTTTANGRLTNGSSTVTTEDSAIKALKPTSTVDGTNWYKAVAAETNSSVKTGDYTLVANGDLANYRALYTFYLQDFDATQSISSPYASTSPAKDIVVETVKVAGVRTKDAGDSTYVVADPLYECLRVLVVQDTNKVFVSPLKTVEATNAGANSTTTTTLVGWADSTSVADAALSAANASYTCTLANTSNDARLVSSVAFNQVYTVNVYVYFDGEDANCYSDNVTTFLSNLSVEVAFNLIDHVA